MKTFIPFGCEIVRVVDGDTIVVNIDLGFDVWLKNEYVRLFGLDVAERHTDAGKQATRIVEAWVAIFSTDEFRWELQSHDFERGKYGRILGDLRPIAAHDPELVADSWGEVIENNPHLLKGYSRNDS